MRRLLRDVSARVEREFRKTAVHLAPRIVATLPLRRMPSGNNRQTFAVIEQMLLGHSMNGALPDDGEQGGAVPRPLHRAALAARMTPVRRDEPYNK